MAVTFDVITIFPEIFAEFLRLGLLGKAIQRKLLEVKITDLKEFGCEEEKGDKTRLGSIDDRPYGGGDGMILAPEPLGQALDSVEKGKRPVIFLTPQGEPFSHARAEKLAGEGGAVLICGRYGGIDERIREIFVDEEISVGDYVLMGGEIPAMVVIEACARYIPQVLGNEDSAHLDSHQQGLLEGPQYTRPRQYRGLKVPEVLLSGNHQEIDNWRQEGARERTRQRRADLWQKYLKTKGQ